MADETHDARFLSRPPPEGQPELVPSADGGLLHCLHAGEGPAVVLAHGYLLDLAVFKLVFSELVASGRRVIAFDQRGHGDSRAGDAGCTPEAAAADYRTIMEHFDVREGTLVAHSMGAFLGLLFCMQHGPSARQHLARLVLLGGNAGAVASGSLQNRLQIPLLKSGLLRPLWSYRPTGRALIGQLFGATPDPQQVEATREMILRQQVSASLPLLHAMIHDDHYAQLAEVPVPAQVLCGEHDRTCPRWHSERLGAEIPASANTWIPDAGHMLSYEAPEAVVAAVTTA